MRVPRLRLSRFELVEAHPVDKELTAVIIDIDHETGDLTQYTSVVNPDGDLSVAAEAALADTNYGLRIFIDDTTAIYGAFDLAFPYSTTGKLRARFYIDPNSLTMANSDNFSMFEVWATAGLILRLVLRYITGSGYNIRSTFYNDTGGSTTVDHAVFTDAPHYIEVNIVRATTNVSADGSMQLWIDDLDQGITGNVDNYDRFVNFRTLSIGAILSVDVGTSGIFFVDEIIVNNDGSEIGPV
jgi:hypothetical protein